MKAIFQNSEIGDPAYDGLTFGGYALTTPLLKADYPGLRAIRLEDGTVILAEDLPDSYTIPPGGGGGGDHADSDHADAFSPLAHTHAAHADSDHDDRFSLLAHTHAAHADSDHDDRFSLLAHAHAGVYAPVEHDTTHDDRFSLLAHTHAAHADSDHDDRFALIEHDSAHSDVYSALAHTHAAHADSDHDDRFSLLAHTHTAQPLDWLTDVATAGQASTNVLTYNGTSWVPAAVPAQSWISITGKPSTFTPAEHDTDHDDRFSLLAHNHSGTYVPTGQGVPAGGSIGQVLAKGSATNYDTVWQSASAPAPQPLDWLTDVNTAGQAATNVLTYNGSAWVPAAVPVSTLGKLGYAQVVASQTGMTTLADLTSLTVTVTVAASRRILVTGQARMGFDAAITNRHQVVGYIREGSTTLGQFGNWNLEGITTGGGRNELRSGAVSLTPTAGSHTYKLSLERNAGTVSTVGISAAADNPAFILVEDIGPA